MDTTTTAQQAAQWAQFTFYLVTIISILAAAALGVFKYRLFRTGRPFITITLTTSSRPSSQSHIQIGVTAQLHNGSRVLAKAQSLEWECRAIGTYQDDVIDAKITEYFTGPDDFTRKESGHSEFPWNVQQRITRQNLNITIEPGEYSHDNVTFVVPDYCTAVQIRLFIPAAPGSNQGWTSSRLPRHPTEHTMKNPFSRNPDPPGAPSRRPTPPESAEQPMPEIELREDQPVDRPTPAPSAEIPMPPPPSNDKLADQSSNNEPDVLED